MGRTASSRIHFILFFFSCRSPAFQCDFVKALEYGLQSCLPCAASCGDSCVASCTASFHGYTLLSLLQCGMLYLCKRESFHILQISFDPMGGASVRQFQGSQVSPLDLSACVLSMLSDY